MGKKTNFKEFIALGFRRAVSNNIIRSIAKVFHINIVGKKLYFSLFAPKNSKVSHTISGINAQFYVKNYTELIYLTETVVGAGDERHVITMLLESLRPGDVVYDVGSFLGIHAIFLAKWLEKNNGNVVAFEPSLYSYEGLKSNITLNEVHNITPLNMALGKTVSEGIIGGTDMSSYSLHDCLDGDTTGQKITIRPGDLVIKEKNLPSPTIIKIDVEGYEYNVVEGLKEALAKPECRLVCCEVHPTLLPTGVTAQILEDRLRGMGFTQISTYGRGSTYHIFCHKPHETL